MLGIIEVLIFKLAKLFVCSLLGAKLGWKLFGLFGFKWRQYEWHGTWWRNTLWEFQVPTPYFA